MNNVLTTGSGGTIAWFCFEKSKLADMIMNFAQMCLLSDTVSKTELVECVQECGNVNKW